MPEQYDILLKKIAAFAGWHFGLITKRDFEDHSLYLTPIKKEFTEIAFTDTEMPIDAIYFSGDNPFIHFKQLSDFNPKVVRNLHQKIWNQGRIPFLAIITPIETRLYDCFDTPVENDDNLENLKRGSFQNNVEDDLKRLGELLHQSKIDSGIIWEEGQLGQKIRTSNRVDRKLVKNLALTRKILSEEYNLPLNIIHDLLGRSLFTLYLEDRGILTSKDFPTRPDNVNNFFDLLNYREATYELFHFLKEKFNGDLFPVSAKEEKLLTKLPKCLDAIKNCWTDNIEQLSFNNWRLFQFQYIPIELISSIYEEFMSEEDEKHSEIIKEKGAYYTPQMLVEFVLNEVLPWPDENNNDYDLKILDPACGSGIFLVECYKRLIARWKYSNKSETITQDVLERLLLNNIYGIEKDSQAIKVTAFSLYLSFLSYLEPKKILSEVKFRPLVRWSDKKELEELEGKKPGNNLFQFSTFTKSLELLNHKFDLIVGNPPWKKDKPEEDVKEYLDVNNLPSQIMCAYLHYMPKLAPNGVVCLISAAKIFFNTGGGYENFRKNLFTENKVDAIINLAVVRDILFKNASSPGVVIIYRKRNSAIVNYDNENVLYCVPKSVETINLSRSIVIDASEVKFLPVREILKENSKVFKIAMWGNVRDLKLIEKFSYLKTLKEIIPSDNCATGLHKAVDKSGNPHLKDYLFFPTEAITQYYVSRSNLLPLGNHHKYFRPIIKDIFDAPVVIIKEGTENGNICSAYVGFNCAYKAATLGIKLKGKSKNHHKALTAFLNSSFAHYYIFMTSSSWGIDKAGRNQNNSILILPAIVFEMTEMVVNQLASRVDQIIAIKSSNKIELDGESRIEFIQKDIDKIIYKELNISSNEISLIEDTLNYSIALHNRYIASKAESFVSPSKEMKTYAKTLIKTINSILKKNNKGVWVEILDSNNSKVPLQIIAMHFDHEKEFGSIEVISNSNISKLLSEINKDTYEKHSESIYYRKVTKYYKGKTIYLAKPNQKRFWSISQALNDADNILLDLTNQ
ncbi:MAG: HsdM family class I SAM-dependent methyltransferase [Melioribacteraceae bacterium]